MEMSNDMLEFCLRSRRVPEGMPNAQSQLSDDLRDLPDWIRPYFPMITDLVVALLILVVGWFISKWVHKAALSGFRRAHMDEALARFLSSIGQYCVLAATIISALNRVGIQTTSLVALLASAGLAVGLALQGSLSSFASGVMILVFRPFMLGDQVQLSGLTGTVEDIGLFQTTLAAADGERIILPNSAITSNPILNYSAKGTRRVAVEVSVAPQTPPDEAVSHLLAAASQVSTALATPEPSVGFNALTANSLNLTVWVWTHAPDYGVTQSDLRKAITSQLSSAGVGGPAPGSMILKGISV